MTSAQFCTWNNTSSLGNYSVLFDDNVAGHGHVGGSVGTKIPVNPSEVGTTFGSERVFFYAEQVGLPSLEPEGWVDPIIWIILIIIVVAAAAVVTTLLLIRYKKKSKRVRAEKLETVGQMVRVSSRMKIDDIANTLNVPRAVILKKLVELAEQNHFKIEEDVVVFESGSSSDDFVKKLEQDFESWGKSNQKVDTIAPPNICPSCSEVNPVGAKFCNKCGKPI